jgi:hypothetical protein
MAKAETKRITGLIDKAVEILEEESPMTIRQLFYRLVSMGALENRRNDYVKVSRIMTIARNDGRVDWDAIVDRSRPDYMPTVWDDAAEYAAAVSSSYRKDYWSTQPVLVEIWVEKDAIVGSIQPLTRELGVRVRPGKGFQSTTKVHEIVGLFKRTGRPIFVYYLGDHDPSGRCAEDELHQRVMSQLPALKAEVFHMTRLAIHAKDIRKFNLPPLKVKTSDSRSESFIAEHGTQCVELDALPVNELRSRIRGTVEKHIDWPSWERMKAVESAERGCIVEFADRMRALLVKEQP